MELWGGFEATVARVGAHYVDQIRLTGHHARPEDLDRVAALGIRTVRYPVLWERVAPDGLARADWRWTDARLARLRRLGMRPIVGLIHHGSGPRDTSLLDPDFPARFAAYARAVAERYPWVTDWTPVNEPLTTARFSTLYGHWYPHRRDDRDFTAALLNQIWAVRAAMAEIRRVIPGARLVQTEDLGFTHGTPDLREQAEYENWRRWLSFDLLTGRVDRVHPLRTWLEANGADPRRLAALAAAPTPPGIVGVNHYLSSERFLDSRLALYPGIAPGGNGRSRYVDILAVRARDARPQGPGALLRQAWERYGLPVAVTEAHNGSTRDEQARWLLQVWDEAAALARDGADIRAVTLWSLLGCVDWNSMLTIAAGHYEPGVFDIRSGTPRPTFVAKMAAQLARGERPDHPVLHQPGWWRRPDRFIGLPPPDAAMSPGLPIPAVSSQGRRPVLITGGEGRLGRAAARSAATRGLAVIALGRGALDIAVPGAVEAALRRHRPWAVVNAAGFARIEAAEADPEACRRSNAAGPHILAEACARHGVPLASFSCGLVFRGDSGRPYLEHDRVAPLNTCGLSLAEGERLILETLPAAMVIRTSACFGPWGESDFVARTLRAAAAGRPVPATTNVVSPTFLPDLMQASLDLLLDGAEGLWHLVNATPASWAELARLTLRRAGLPLRIVQEVTHDALGWRAPRPANSALATVHGIGLPPLEEALERCLRERPPEAVAGGPA